MSISLDWKLPTNPPIPFLTITATTLTLPSLLFASSNSPANDPRSDQPNYSLIIYYILIEKLTPTHMFSMWLGRF